MVAEYGGKSDRHLSRCLAIMIILMLQAQGQEPQAAPLNNEPPDIICYTIQDKYISFRSLSSIRMNEYAKA